MKLKLEPLSSSVVAQAKMGAQPVTQKILIDNPSKVTIISRTNTPPKKKKKTKTKTKTKKHFPVVRPLFVSVTS